MASGRQSFEPMKRELRISFHFSGSGVTIKSS
jgi:hypothetical protein